MDIINDLLNTTNKNLEDMDIRLLEYELNNYFVLLNIDPDFNSIIIQKILYIKYLIEKKKNQ
tara:strand:+ start:377 stop:562 length:186 start_codon:yes stop_codon:yes gene_type:complete